MDSRWQCRKKADIRRISAPAVLTKSQLSTTMPAKKASKKVAVKKVAKKATNTKKAAPAKKAAAKAVKPPAKKAEAPAKKAAKKVAAKAPVKKAKAKSTAKTPPTLEEITKAAYLNYRRRIDLGLPGDDDSDWLEAERSLTKA